ncbi:MAG: GlmU family protein, partial [Roseiflexaceae bacterium]|nr:GlmU family protein [Roseiflexaceae bacterium]
MIVLFEDAGYRALLPLVQARPVYELRCGVWTLRERLELQMGVPPQGICRPHLATVFGAGRWPLGLLGGSAPLTFVNGRALHAEWVEQLAREDANTLYVTDAGPGVLGEQLLLGARLTPALASAVLADLLAQDASRALNELRRFCRVVEVAAELLTFPWDIIIKNGAQIGRDVALLERQGWRSADQAAVPPHVIVHAPEQVYLHPEARLDGPIVLDARGGPIVIDAAHIEPFSFIQGPAAVGRGALISSARIRGETTIGPVCRIGGEVEASVVQGYANKHHDGFLGHSYLGAWVNIGAMTTNSDLKNTYGNIKVVLDGLGQVDSGQIKLGAFLADHVKLGIGLHLNGGSMIGTGSNIFGVHFAPKTVPAFTWGGEVFREYQIDRMIGVSRKVMGRRKLVLTPEMETMLREVFATTRGSRASMVEPAEGRAAMSEDSIALA